MKVHEGKLRNALVNGADHTLQFTPPVQKAMKAHEISALAAKIANAQVKQLKMRGLLEHTEDGMNLAERIIGGAAQRSPASVFDNLAGLTEATTATKMSAGVAVTTSALDKAAAAAARLALDSPAGPTLVKKAQAEIKLARATMKKLAAVIEKAQEPEDAAARTRQRSIPNTGPRSRSADRGVRRSMPGRLGS